MSGIKHRWQTTRTWTVDNRRVSQQRCEICGLFRWWRNYPDPGEKDVFLHRDDIRWQTIDDDEVLELVYRRGPLVRVLASAGEGDLSRYPKCSLASGWSVPGAPGPPMRTVDGWRRLWARAQPAPTADCPRHCSGFRLPEEHDETPSCDAGAARNREVVTQYDKVTYRAVKGG